MVQIFRGSSYPRIINAYGRGTALVEVSTDSGQTYLTVGTFKFGTYLTKQKLDFTVTSDFFRFRLSGTDPSFQLADLVVRYLDGSEF